MFHLFSHIQPLDILLLVDLCNYLKILLNFQLANIIWDEGAESGDHIVPYPKGSEDCRNKKEWKQEATIIKPTEQKIREAKIDLHAKKLESSSNLVSDDKSSDPRMGVESWPDLPLSNAADSERQSMGTEVSNGLSEITKYDSSKGNVVEITVD